MSRPKMFYGAVSSVFKNAKELRGNMTEAEEKLWSHINNKHLGFHFKPQHPISRFIADFYCHKAKLIIELDREIHRGKQRKEYDINREAVLKRFGVKVIRFTNEDVINNIKRVIGEIKKQLPEQ